MLVCVRREGVRGLTYNGRGYRVFRVERNIMRGEM